jgi:hypothetical protein
LVAALALVASVVSTQFGLLGFVIMRQAMQRPIAHLAYLAGLMLTVTLAGWALGTAIRSLIGGGDLLRFVLECFAWVAVVAVVSTPLLSARLRNRLADTIPR